MIQINTKNILFISGGAFDGIEKKIGARLQTNMIGYNIDREREKIDRDNILQYVAPQDLKSFGLIPEIVGRFPVVTYLNPLDQITLRRILTEPKNAIVKQFIKLFEMDNIQLSFDDHVLDFIVDKSVEFKLGARGLRSIIEEIMTDAMFDAPSDNKLRRLNIDIDYAKDKLQKISVTKLKVA